MVLNGSEGPESDFGGSKIRKEGPILVQFGQILPKFGPTKLILVTLRDSYKCVGGYIWGLFSKNIEF